MNEALETGHLNLRRALNLRRRRRRLRFGRRLRFAPAPCACRPPCCCAPCQRVLLCAAATQWPSLSCKHTLLPCRSYLTDPAAVEACLSAALAAGAHVAELDLSSCGLAVLPPWLATPQLARCLRRLTLKYNALNRLDAALLARLPRLEALDLEGCQVAAVAEGELPALPALRSLNLSSNGLAALPADLAACPALEALLAANNPLAQLPDALGACPALQLLDVSGCRLGALPPSLAQCRTLQRLFCQVRGEGKTEGGRRGSSAGVTAGSRGRGSLPELAACSHARPPLQPPHPPTSPASIHPPTTPASEQRAATGSHRAGPPARPARVEPTRQPPAAQV